MINTMHCLITFISFFFYYTQISNIDVKLEILSQRQMKIQIRILTYTFDPECGLTRNEIKHIKHFNHSLITL